MIWALVPGPVKRAVAWLLAGLGAVWAIRASAKREARQRAALEAQAAIIKTLEVRNEVENRIDRGGAPADRLREKWGRD